MLKERLQAIDDKKGKTPPRPCLPLIPLVPRSRGDRGLAVTLFVLYNPFIPEFDLRARLQANLRASVLLDRRGKNC